MEILLGIACSAAFGILLYGLIAAVIGLWEWFKLDQDDFIWYERSDLCCNRCRKHIDKCGCYYDEIGQPICKKCGYVAHLCPCGGPDPYGSRCNKCHRELDDCVCPDESWDSVN